MILLEKKCSVYQEVPFLSFFFGINFLVIMVYSTWRILLLAFLGQVNLANRAFTFFVPSLTLVDNQ